MKDFSKKIILCTLLCSTSIAVSEVSTGNQAFGVVNNLIDKVFAQRDKDSSGNSQGGLLNMAGGNVPELPKGIQGLTGSLFGGAGANGTTGGAGGNSAPGANGAAGVNGTSGSPGANGAAGANGNNGGVVNNVTYNISNMSDNRTSIDLSQKLPKGFQPVMGADGKPLAAQTQVGADGTPVKIVQAIDAQGKQVVLEQKTGADGKPSIVEHSKGVDGQPIARVLPLLENPVLGAGGAGFPPAMPQFGVGSPSLPGSGTSGLPAMQQAGAVSPATFSGMTEEGMQQVLLNPYENGRNLEIYNALLDLANQDPATKKALEVINGDVAERDAPIARYPMLLKFVKEMKLNEMQTQQQVAQQAAVAAEQAKARAAAEEDFIKKRAETIERYKKENQQLINKLTAAGTQPSVIAETYRNAMESVNPQGVSTFTSFGAPTTNDGMPATPAPSEVPVATAGIPTAAAPSEAPVEADEAPTAAAPSEAPVEADETPVPLVAPAVKSGPPPMPTFGNEPPVATAASAADAVAAVKSGPPPMPTFG